MSENYSYLEQETNINYNREEAMAVIYTASSVDIRKLDKLFEQHSDEIQLREKTEASRTYLVPKKWIKIRPPRQLSEETLKKLKENASKNLKRPN